MRPPFRPQGEAAGSVEEQQQEELQEMYDYLLEDEVDLLLDSPEVERGLRWKMNEEIHNFDATQAYELGEQPAAASAEQGVRGADRGGHQERPLPGSDSTAPTSSRRRMLTMEGLERSGSDIEEEEALYREKQGEKERVEAEVRWRQQQRDLAIKANLESESPVPPHHDRGAGDSQLGPGGADAGAAC